MAKKAMMVGDRSDDACSSASSTGNENQEHAREYVHDLLGAGEDAVPQSLGAILAGYKNGARVFYNEFSWMTLFFRLYS
jgi:hypothetical protein